MILGLALSPAGGGQHSELKSADGAADADLGRPAGAADGGRQGAAVRQEDRQGREWNNLFDTYFRERTQLFFSTRQGLSVASSEHT